MTIKRSINENPLGLIGCTSNISFYYELLDDMVAEIYIEIGYNQRAKTTVCLTDKKGRDITVSLDTICKICEHVEDRKTFDRKDGKNIFKVSYKKEGKSVVYVKLKGDLNFEIVITQLFDLLQRYETQVRPYIDNINRYNRNGSAEEVLPKYGY